MKLIYTIRILVNLLLITFSNGFAAIKDKVGGPTYGFVENIAPIYCTNDWMCNTYCTPGRIAYCPSINKMGPEVKYGTCFCCDDHLGYLEQSSFGCTGGCSQVSARVMVETKAPQACPDKTSGSYFSWFGGPMVRQDPHGMVKKEKEELHGLKVNTQSILK